MKLKPKNVARVLMLAVLGGILLSDLVPFSPNATWPLFSAVVIALLVVALIFRNSNLWLINFSVILFILSNLLASNLIIRHFPPSDFQQQKEFYGLIVEKPILDEKQKIVVLAGETRVLVNLPRYPEYGYGQRVKISGKLELPTIFPDFNYRNYLKGQQIYLVVNRVEKIEVLAENGSKIKKWLYSVSNRFETILNKSLPEPESAFAAGLILGSKRGLPDSLISQMQNSGTSHLVAISGYNISVIIVALSLLFNIFGRRLNFILSIIFVISFVVLSGGAASVVRGAIVGLMVLLGKSLDRRANQTNILLLSAILLLSFNPLMLIYDYGFLLSFSAFAGLIYFSPVLDLTFQKHRILNKIPSLLSGPLKETLSAQFMSLPLLIFAFGKVSIIAPLSNLLILPFIPLTMAFSFTVGFLGIIYQPLGLIAGFVAWPLLKYSLLVIQYCGRLTFASIDFGKNWFWLMVILYLFIALTVYRNKKIIQRHVKIH